MPENILDIIIIGGGPSGLTAGIYAARARMNVLLIEKMGCGGQNAITDWIENYPGFPEGISGFELSGKFEEQAKKFGLKIAFEEVKSVSVDADSRIKTLKTAENQYSAYSVIIASGAEYKMLDIPGELDLRGRGVSYCATCDGPFFRGKEVVVVGGGDSAVQEAIYLTRFASKVTIVHRRDRFRATKILSDRALSNNKIQVVWNSTAVKISGKDKVEAISIKNVVSGVESEIACGGVFIFVGHSPNTVPFSGLLKMDDKGYIFTDNDMGTSVPGIFCCGDSRNKLLRQVVTAAGDGATAAFAAQEYVENILGTSYK